MITAHNILIVFFFFVFSCVDILFLNNQSPKAINLVKNGNLSMLRLFWRPFFVNIATVKFKFRNFKLKLIF